LDGGGGGWGVFTTGLNWKTFNHAWQKLSFLDVKAMTSKAKAAGRLITIIGGKRAAKAETLEKRCLASNTRRLEEITGAKLNEQKS